MPRALRGRVLSCTSRTYPLLKIYVYLPSLSDDLRFVSGCNNGRTCPAATFCCPDGTCAASLASCGEGSVDSMVLVVGAVMLLVYCLAQAAATAVSTCQVQLLHVVYARYLRTVKPQSVANVASLFDCSLCLSGNRCDDCSFVFTRFPVPNMASDY